MEDRWQLSAEPGTRNTVHDLEHPDGARITLERNGEIAPFEMTCGVYGFFVHTCFFDSITSAESALPSLKAQLETILELAAVDHNRAIEAVESFVEAN